MQRLVPFPQNLAEQYLACIGYGRFCGSKVTCLLPGAMESGAVPSVPGSLELENSEDVMEQVVEYLESGAGLVHSNQMKRQLSWECISSV